MYGICLQCELCNTTIGGEQVTKNPEPALNYTQHQELRKRAAALGWHSIPSKDEDYCPQHNTKKK